MRLDAYPFAPHVRRLGVSLAFDVGANIGQFGKLLRANHYRGRIVSFEPALRPFEELSKAAAADVNWTAERCALGIEPGVLPLNVSPLSEVNSFLPLRSDAPWQMHRAENVSVRRLDDVFSKYASSSDTVLLKIDVQGFEPQVINGGVQSLSHIALVQMEAAVAPLYEGELPLTEQIKNMEAHGFQLIDVHPVYRNDAGQLMHVDCMFERF